MIICVVEWTRRNARGSERAARLYRVKPAAMKRAARLREAGYEPTIRVGVWTERAS